MNLRELLKEIASGGGGAPTGPGGPPGDTPSTPAPTLDSTARNHGKPAGGGQGLSGQGTLKSTGVFIGHETPQEKHDYTAKSFIGKGIEWTKPTGVVSSDEKVYKETELETPGEHHTVGHEGEGVTEDAEASSTVSGDIATVAYPLFVNGRNKNAKRRAARRAVGQRVAEGKLNEFAPGAGDEGGGEDPYKYPKPEHFSRSIDFFGQFEAEHFDREDMNDATGEFKGYWGKDQLAYFKFDNPQRTGNDDPGMGWYYEPNAGSSNNNSSAKPVVDNTEQRKQQELSMIRAFLKSGNRPNPDSQIGRLMKKHGMTEGVAETLPLNDALKLLRQYGAENLKTTSNALHFYKNGRAFSVDLVMNPDATRSASLSSLNSATRGLKGQGVAEGESVSLRDMVNVVDRHYPKYYAELSGSDISDKQFERAIENAYKKIMQKQGVAEGANSKVSVTLNGQPIGHIERDTVADDDGVIGYVGVVYDGTARPYTLHGYEDRNELKHAIADVYRNRVAKKGVAEGFDEAHAVGNDSVIYRLDRENPMSDTEVLVLGGAGRYSLKALRDKARREAAELAQDLSIEHGGAFRRSATNIKQLTNTINTIVAAYNELARLRRKGGRGSRGITDEDANFIRECIRVVEQATQNYRLMEGLVKEPDPKGYAKNTLNNPKYTIVVNTPGDLDWYKIGTYWNNKVVDPHEFGQDDSDTVLVAQGAEEYKEMLDKIKRMGLTYKIIGGTSDQPEIHEKNKKGYK